MSASESKRLALEALAYMRLHESDPNRCFGYAWNILGRISGQVGLPLPHEQRAADAVDPWRVIDPRGPIRSIVAIKERTDGTAITKDCGHTSDHAPHFMYKLGARIHCYQCREAPENLR